MHFTSQRFQKLIYLHLFTVFHEGFSPTVETNTVFFFTIHMPYTVILGGAWIILVGG